MFDFKELQKRVITSLIGISVLSIVYYYGFIAEFLSFFLLFILYSEMLISVYSSSANLLKKTIVFIFGFIYMMFGIGALADLGSSVFIIYLLACVFVFDSASYFGGKIFKGPLLCSCVSPNKTWSGFLIGSVFSSIAFYYFFLIDFFGQNNLLIDLLLALGFVLILQIGDLLVSFAKRVLGVKNSSNLLAGHGGFWDRCDTIFAGAIFLLFLRTFVYVSSGVRI